MTLPGGNMNLDPPMLMMSCTTRTDLELSAQTSVALLEADALYGDQAEYNELAARRSAAKLSQGTLLALARYASKNAKELNVDVDC